MYFTIIFFATCRYAKYFRNMYSTVFICLIKINIDNRHGINVLHKPKRDTYQSIRNWPARLATPNAMMVACTAMAVQLSLESSWARFRCTRQGRVKMYTSPEMEPVNLKQTHLHYLGNPNWNMYR